ncbi:MAG TPA: DUF559 domain-containing protein, partial [Sphingomonadaceae bacterium]|nr:DUF559 domain-containing protein [Sphingomonadaceae bacterium]
GALELLKSETARAREFRNNPTEAECLLWQHISAKKLGGFRFNRQAQIGPYFCDFVARGPRLIGEIDGGHHNHKDGRLRDAHRTAFLNAQGYHLIRFWNSEVLDNVDGVLKRIEHVLADGPSPFPSQMGGETVEPRTNSAG